MSTSHPRPARPAPSQQLVMALALGLPVLLAACSVGSAPRQMEAPAAPAPVAAAQPFAGTCGMADFATPAQALAKLNAYRAVGARCGTAGSFGPTTPLDWSPVLAGVALAHSREMASRGVLDHQSADGRALGQRLAGAGVQPQFAAENIAYGQGSLAQVMAGWLHSPGHCANLMAANASEAALACQRGPDGTPWWTLVLTRVR